MQVMEVSARNTTRRVSTSRDTSHRVTANRPVSKQELWNTAVRSAKRIGKAFRRKNVVSHIHTYDRFITIWVTDDIDIIDDDKSSAIANLSVDPIKKQKKYIWYDYPYMYGYEKAYKKTPMPLAIEDQDYCIFINVLESRDKRLTDDVIQGIQVEISSADLPLKYPIGLRGGRKNKDLLYF